MLAALSNSPRCRRRRLRPLCRRPLLPLLPPRLPPSPPPPLTLPRPPPPTPTPPLTPPPAGQLHRPPLTPTPPPPLTPSSHSPPHYHRHRHATAQSATLTPHPRPTTAPPAASGRTQVTRRVRVAETIGCSSTDARTPFAPVAAWPAGGSASHVGKGVGGSISCSRAEPTTHARRARTSTRVGCGMRGATGGGRGRAWPDQ